MNNKIHFTVMGLLIGALTCSVVRLYSWGLDFSWWIYSLLTLVLGAACLALLGGVIFSALARRTLTIFATAFALAAELSVCLVEFLLWNPYSIPFVSRLVYALTGISVGSSSSDLPGFDLYRLVGVAVGITLVLAGLVVCLTRWPAAPAQPAAGMNLPFSRAAPAPAASTAPAGWYAHPSGLPQPAYWDGRSWRFDLPVPPPQAPGRQQAPGQRF